MMPVSMKATMLSLWLFSFIVIIQSLIKRPKITRDQAFLIILPASLFIWLLIVNLSKNSFEDILPFMERKVSLLLIPILLLLSQNIKGMNLKWAMRGFLAGLCITGIHMLFNAGISIVAGNSFSQWTYHAFTAPYEIGAIYYSWYLSIAIAYLIFSKRDFLIEKYYQWIILFMLTLLLLSSSKLFIILVIPLILWSFTTKLKLIKRRLLGLLILILILAGGAYPFIQRMDAISSFDKEIIFQEQYNYDTPFNGITLRLIQWRFGFEILQESDAWFSGVGSVSSQALLNEKYREYGIYTGNEEIGDQGYLDYNYHNQYMETMLSSGIVGTILLLMILWSVLISNRKILIFPSVVFLITIMFFFTESVLERQAGILIFCLMICYAPINRKKIISTDDV